MTVYDDAVSARCGHSGGTFADTAFAPVSRPADTVSR